MEQQLNARQDLLELGKGSKRKHKVNSLETLSPVTKITVGRLLITIMMTYKLEIHQMDVPTQFSFFMEKENEKKVIGFCHRI